MGIAAELERPTTVGAVQVPKKRPGVWWSVLRPVLFWTHLAAGLASGIVVLIMSVTGVALTYQKQMTAWADLRGLEGAPPAAGATRLPADALIARLRSDSAVAPTSIVWRAGANQPVEMVLPEGRRVFVNAYTGEVLGSGSAAMRKFFRVMTDWHRWLAMSGDQRAKGRAITGASNLAFLVLVLSGIWLWWPRNLSRIAFRNVMSFRRGLSAKARDFNWHNVIGFWSFAPLVFVVASGVVISYPWASDLVYRVAGEAPPARSAPAAAGAARQAAEPQSTRGAPRGNDRDAAPVAGVVRVPVETAFANAVSTAAHRMPDWRAISLTMPRSDTASFAFTIDRGMGGEPHKRAQLALSREGVETRWQSFSDQSTARQWRSILRFAHTGEVLGVVGQTIAGLVSLGATLLVYTGIALSWRRWRAWRAR